MKVKVFDTQENNEFTIEAEHFLRINKAYPQRFKSVDPIAAKLVNEVSLDDIDIGTTKDDEEKWKQSLDQAKEKERVDRLSKVVAEKLAVITNKINSKAKPVEIPEVKNEQTKNPDNNAVELPNNTFNKKDLDQMDMSQLVAIYTEIFPNKKIPKSKKAIVAEILQ